MVGSLQNKLQQAQQKKLGGNVLMGLTTNGQLLLQENSQEWAHYPTLYQESRKDWAVIPYEEMIRWCQQRSDYTIGDFGCGEAKLALHSCGMLSIARPQGTNIFQLVIGTVLCFK